MAGELESGGEVAMATRQVSLGKWNSVDRMTSRPVSDKLRASVAGVKQRWCSSQRIEVSPERIP